MYERTYFEVDVDGLLSRVRHRLIFSAVHVLLVGIGIWKLLIFWYMAVNFIRCVRSFINLYVTV